MLASRPNGRPCSLSQAALSTVFLASSISIAMSASLNCMAWNSEMARPNCLRSLARPSASSKTSLGQPDRERGDRDPTAVERLKELLESDPTLAEQVLFRHPAVLEVERALVGGAPAELLVAGAARVPGGVLRDDDRGQLRPAVLAGSGPGDDRDAGGDVGAGVGDPFLRAVYDPVLAFKLRRRAGAARVGAGLLEVAKAHRRSPVAHCRRNFSFCSGACRPMVEVCSPGRCGPPS